MDAMVVLGILSEMGKERLQRGFWVGQGQGVASITPTHTVLARLIHMALSRFNKGLKVQLLNVSSCFSMATLLYGKIGYIFDGQQLSLPHHR